MSDNAKLNSPLGWVLYDGECRLCRKLARRFAPLLARHRFALAPLQTPWVQERLGLKPNELLAEMRLLNGDGRICGGADAILQIARHIDWVRPFSALARIPGVMPLLRAGYRWLAEHRSCAGGVCGLRKRGWIHEGREGHEGHEDKGGCEKGPAGQSGVRFSLLNNFFLRVLRGFNFRFQSERLASRHWPAWTLLTMLPVGVLFLRKYLPAWAFMWTLAVAIGFGCKWLTWCLATRAAGRANLLRSLGYLLAWPGMDAATFLDAKHKPPRPTVKPWTSGALNLVAGAALVWIGVPLLADRNPLAAAWAGAVGLCGILHFGSFHLLALAWQLRGVDAQPIMQAPIKSASLSEFWGRRWNAAFNALAFDFVFRPLARGAGGAAATLAAFLISGWAHELVISIPARGGYGQPTAYFLVQGLGVLFERSAFGRSLGLGVGWRGWSQRKGCHELLNI